MDVRVRVGAAPPRRRDRWPITGVAGDAQWRVGEVQPGPRRSVGEVTMTAPIQSPILYHHVNGYVRWSLASDQMRSVVTTDERWT